MTLAASFPVLKLAHTGTTASADMEYKLNRH